MDEQLTQPLGRDRRACQFVGQQVAQRFVEVLVIEDGGLQEVAEGGLGQAKGAESTSLKRGRPQIAIGINPDAAAIITVVLSLNSLSAALIDYSGAIVTEEHRRLSTLTVSRANLLAEADALLASAAGRDLSLIHISEPTRPY